MGAPPQAFRAVRHMSCRTKAARCSPGETRDGGCSCGVDRCLGSGGQEAVVGPRQTRQRAGRDQEREYDDCRNQQVSAQSLTPAPRAWARDEEAYTLLSRGATEAQGCNRSSRGTNGQQG